MAKFKSKGLQVKIGTSSYVAATTIAQLGDGTLELGEREGLVDVTTHDNTTGTTDQLDVGFKSPLSYSGEILWDPDDVVHELLRSSLEAGTELFCRIILSNTGAAQFDAKVRVKALSSPQPVKGKLGCNVSLEGVGATTFTQ